ncbi:hypothetical protein DPMN_036475 [Dreissena polymorpha]|uniref:Uncharacterized protein n=1 Tax=Dreissena polymorpha TaxID=45954 RepID=A0A9D4M9H7_DREPO|nr:hypothetical protein DPMN_036475 [Dreissena polymorpha]
MERDVRYFLLSINDDDHPLACPSAQFPSDVCKPSKLSSFDGHQEGSLWEI